MHMTCIFILTTEHCWTSSISIRSCSIFIARIGTIRLTATTSSSSARIKWNVFCGWILVTVISNWTRKDGITTMRAVCQWLKRHVKVDLWYNCFFFDDSVARFKWKLQINWFSPLICVNGFHRVTTTGFC